MSKIGKRLRGLDGGRVGFMCPGCKEIHAVGIEPPAEVRWDWNGNTDAPGFFPSIKVSGTRANLSDEEWEELMKRTHGERDAMLADKRTTFVCHSFVRGGRIEFLSDCTHALAGQTVELPEIEDEP